MNVSRSAILSALVACGAPVTAQEVASFDGLYRASPTTDCATVGGAGGALKIEDGVLHGADARCRMTQPVNVRDMDAQLFDMECESNGDSFSERALMMHAADGGLVLVWDGYAFKYDRCTDDPAEGTVTRADDIGIVEE